MNSVYPVDTFWIELSMPLLPRIVVHIRELPEERKYVFRLFSTCKGLRDYMREHKHDIRKFLRYSPVGIPLNVYPETYLPHGLVIKKGAHRGTLNMFKIRDYDCGYCVRKYGGFEKKDGKLSYFFKITPDVKVMIDFEYVSGGKCDFAAALDTFLRAAKGPDSIVSHPSLECPKYTVGQDDDGTYYRYMRDSMEPVDAKPKDKSRIEEGYAAFHAYMQRL